MPIIRKIKYLIPNLKEMNFIKKIIEKLIEECQIFKTKKCSSLSVLVKLRRRCNQIHFLKTASKQYCHY